MARIKFGAIVSGIDGSIGGHTLQQNRYGNSIRSKPIPLKRVTPNSANTKSLFLSCTSSWRLLSKAEQLQWNQFTSYSPAFPASNNLILLSGYNLFSRYQFQRLFSGLPLLTTFLYLPLPILPTFTIHSDENSTLVIIFSSIIQSSRYFFQLRISQAGNNNYNFSGQSIRSIIIPLSSASEFNFTAEYLRLFGTLPLIDQFVSVSISFFSTVDPIITNSFKNQLQIQSL